MWRRSILAAIIATIWTYSFGLASEIVPEHEVECLAQNIYWEARNQPVKGMIAVGMVTMNRVYDDRFPNTYCEVVYAGPTQQSWKDENQFFPKRHKCQFSWYCDGKSDVVPYKDRNIYDIAYNMAFKIYWSPWYFDDNTYGATHYHADYVEPSWAATKRMTNKIGDHIFYAWD